MACICPQSLDTLFSSDIYDNDGHDEQRTVPVTSDSSTAHPTTVIYDCHFRSPEMTILSLTHPYIHRVLCRTGQDATVGLSLPFNCSIFAFFLVRLYSNDLSL